MSLPEKTSNYPESREFVAPRTLLDVLVEGVLSKRQVEDLNRAWAREIETPIAIWNKACTELMSPILESLRLADKACAQALRELENALRSSLKAALQRPQLTSPSLKALSPPSTTQDGESAIARLRKENHTLRQRLEEAHQYIEALGGVVLATDLPPYQWDEDSLPWSNSPD